MTIAKDHIDHGHIYSIADGQHIRFMKKVDGKLVYEGTTNEELIEVLIDRITKLNAKFPCFENVNAIAHLGGALNILNERTKKRLAQGVEGKDIAHV